jgi:hypothetical protein
VVVRVVVAVVMVVILSVEGVRLSKGASFLWQKNVECAIWYCRLLL